MKAQSLNCAAAVAVFEDSVLDADINRKDITGVISSNAVSGAERSTTLFGGQSFSCRLRDLMRRTDEINEPSRPQMELQTITNLSLLAYAPTWWRS